MKLFKIMFVVAVLMLTTLAVAGAAAPGVASGSATVDGAVGEWTISPNDASNVDWFAASHLAGKDDKPEVGDVFIRYDCATETMYVLALHRTTGQVQTDQNADEIRVEIDGSTEVNSASGSFAWVNQSENRADGWEASFTLARPPQDDVAENHTIRVHYLFNDGEAGQTADFAGATVNLSLVCSSDNPTAVSLAGTLGANPDASVPSAALAAAAAMIGLMLTTLLIWKRRERSQHT